MRTLRKKGVSLMLIFTILMAVLMPTIVHAEDSSRVQIIMNENAGNKYGTYMVSGGSFGITVDLDSSIAEFVDIGTEIILSVTPDQYHTFKGWYLAEEYEIVAGLMGWRPIDENSPLSTNATYQFTATESYYNIMPVFESKVGHNNIWTTSGGQVTVLYENRDEQEQPRLDGNHWGTGEVVDYLKGDSITVKAQANENYKFVGWYVSNVQEGPEYYDGNKLVTESSNYTYTPGETRITGIDEPINYITAVFKNRITKVDEFVATSTETEVLSEDEDLEEYINRNLWDISAKNSELNNRWLALFGEVDGVYKYPKHGGVTYVFLNSTTENGVMVNHYRVEYDEVIVTQVATPEREGLQFQVWSNDGGKVSTQFALDEENESMKSRDGSNYVDFDVAGIWKGTEVTVRARADSGYKFIGWKHVDIEYSFDGTDKDHLLPYQGEVISTNSSYTYKPGITIIDGDTEPLKYICAVFEEDIQTPENYTVTFDLNYDGAEPFMTIPNVTSESKVNAPSPDPFRDGYEFEGWFKDQTGTQPFDFENDTIVTNTVIYAKWIENPQITFQLDGATVSENVITFQSGETVITATVIGSGYEFDGNNLKVNESDLNNVKLVLSNNFDNSKMKLKLHDQQELTITGDGEAIFDGLDFSQDNSPHLGLYVENNGGGQGQTGGTEDITFNITANDTYALVDINGKSVIGDGDVSQVQDTYTFNNLLVEEAGETDPTKTNVIKITPRFGEHDITECTINNVVYTLESENVEYRDYGWFITVPGADNYVLTVTGDANSETQRTIIWVNPDYVPENEEDAEWVKDFTISHGTAKVIEVYDKDGHLVSPDTYIGMDADEYGLHDGFGWVAIYPGSRVVFEFVPDYGYQLTGIAINETPLDAIDGNENMNRFEVIIPEENAGNLHFAATFTKTEDIVKANSGKVESGEITLGNELEGGSAQLTVSDVELSSDKIKGFENAAGEYIISNYLDIDLYNVFYKGKSDSEDVWTTKIDELSNEATITLKLADGLTADDIVIVHNVHDGDTYEIIQIESYNPTTNTITFKTKSFSNYAIATKTASTQEDNTNTENEVTDTTADNTNESTTTSNSPKTGDNITMWIGLMLVSILGVFGTFKYLRKRV